MQYFNTDSPLDEQTGDLDLLSPDGGVEGVVVVVGDQLKQFTSCGVNVQEKLDHIYLALHDGVVEAAPVASRPFRKEEHIVSTEDIGLCDYLRTRPKRVSGKNSQGNNPSVIKWYF